MKKLILAVLLSIMGLVLFGSVMAVEEQTTAAVTVTEFLDITLSGVTPDFQNVDPGSSNNPANPDGNGAPQAVIITIESTTNVDTDTFLKGADWTDPATLAITNVLYDDDDKILGGSDNFILETTETNLDPANLATAYTTANNGYFENVACPCGGGSTVKNVFFWLTVPSGQKAGTYTATDIFFTTVKDGATP